MLRRLRTLLVLAGTICFPLLSFAQDALGPMIEAPSGERVKVGQGRTAQKFNVNSGGRIISVDFPIALFLSSITHVSGYVLALDSSNQVVEIVPPVTAASVDLTASVTGVLPIANGGSGAATFSANTVLAGPTSGGAAAPTRRALVAADIPAIALASGVSGTLPIANGGSGAATASANLIFAGPTSGGAAAPSFRSAVAADIGAIALTPTTIVASSTIQGTVLSQTTGGFIVGSRITINQIVTDNAGGIPFWIAPAACKVISATERHVSGSDQADTLTIEKVPSGTAPGAGTVCLAGNFTVNSTVNVNVTVNGHATPATAALAAGNSLAFKFVAQTGTGLIGSITVIIEFT